MIEWIDGGDGIVRGFVGDEVMFYSRKVWQCSAPGCRNKFMLEVEYSLPDVGWCTFYFMEDDLIARNVICELIVKGAGE